MNIQTLKEKLYGLSPQIEAILKESGYTNITNLSAIPMDICNPDERLLYTEFSSLLSHLDYVYTMLNYLQKPILYEGIICINSEGNYEINGIEVNPSDTLEILVNDKDANTYRWRLTSMKYDSDLVGRRVRIRK